MKARMFLTLLAAVLPLGAPIHAPAQTYPSKPIRFIVPFPPGGSTDVQARMIGQKLSETWGQPVVVENRAGGNTVIGTEALAKAAPDGYTIMITAVTHVISPHLIANLPYDTIKDFAPVGTVTSGELILAMHPSVPASNLSELVALAKASPGQLNCASAGSGTITHLACELFNHKAGVKIQHVPYKGGGPALNDLVGGQVQISFLAPLAAIPFIKNGKLKGIAVSGESRLSALPDVPTFSAAGMSGMDVTLWNGILAPAGTPKEIVDKLSVEIARIMATPEVKEKLDGQGLVLMLSTPEQFGALMKSDMAKFGGIIKTADIKLD